MPIIRSSRASDWRNTLCKVHVVSIMQSSRGTCRGAERCARATFRVWLSHWFDAVRARHPRRHEGETVPDDRDLRVKARLSLHRRKRPAPGPIDERGGERGRFAFFLRTFRPGCLSVFKKRPLGCAGFARDPPKVVDQVRFLARALFQSVPRECVGRTAVFEAAGPGSTPGWGTSFASCPWGVTDSHTTLRRSWTRFDSWQGHHFSTLEPDGQATGCNPVQVGSTPTGVSASFVRRKGKVLVFDLPRRRRQT
jgi:hypothetical protein